MALTSKALIVIILIGMDIILVFIKVRNTILMGMI